MKSYPLVPLAEGYARLWHRNDRYGDASYADGHLRPVVNLLIEHGFGNDPEMLSAGWLHDGPEDSGDAMILHGRIRLIKYEFSARTSALVWAVTGIGSNRKQRVLSAYAKIAYFPESAVLKAADRIINARNSKLNKPDLHKMYVKEYGEFRNLVADHIPTVMLDQLDIAHDRSVIPVEFPTIANVKNLDQLIVKDDDDSEYGNMVRTKIEAEKADRIRRAERPSAPSLTLVETPRRDDTDEQ
jgi:(p)ppGpp synthase/HD superfamily hydrolase